MASLPAHGAQQLAISIAPPSLERPDPNVPLSDEFLIPKSRKKKVSTQKGPLFQVQGSDAHETPPLPVKAGGKASKRNMKNEASPLFQQPERSSSNSLPDSSLPDSSSSGSKYLELRLKYLMIEEESFAVGKDLREVEDEVKSLEEEKLALGLVDPSELHPSS